MSAQEVRSPEELLRQEIAALDLQIVTLQNQRAAKVKQISRLRADPAQVVSLERLSNHQLYMVISANRRLQRYDRVQAAEQVLRARALSSEEARP